MSEGTTEPPKQPVVAEAHEVDTFHGRLSRDRRAFRGLVQLTTSQCQRLSSSKATLI